MGWEPSVSLLVERGDSPGHDIVGDGGSRDACGGIGLHALEREHISQRTPPDGRPRKDSGCRNRGEEAVVKRKKGPGETDKHALKSRMRRRRAEVDIAGEVEDTARHRVSQIRDGLGRCQRESGMENNKIKAVAVDKDG
jgi:hypothetical protein